MNSDSSRPAKRLSREQRQQQTRARLLRSAGRILASEGTERVSVEEVAEAAGYTKGAFYSNFESKEDLFLEMLDQHFGQRLREIDRASRTGLPPEDRMRQAAADFIRAVSSNVEFERILFELTVYASRNERFRVELVERYRVLCDRLATILNEHVESEVGSEAGPLPDEAALMLVAMGNGIAGMKLLEPEAVSEELYASMLMVFFRGLATSPDEDEPPVQSGVGLDSARGRR